MFASSDEFNQVSRNTHCTRTTCNWRKSLTIMCTSSLPPLLSPVLRLRMPDAVLSIPSMSLNVMISETVLSRLQ